MEDVPVIGRPPGEIYVLPKAKGKLIRIANQQLRRDFRDAQQIQRLRDKHQLFPESVTK